MDTSKITGRNGFFILKGCELSPREKEILILVAEGGTNKSIADVLSISQKTVEKHRQVCHYKLGIHSIAQLVHYALAKGWTQNIYITQEEKAA